VSQRIAITGSSGMVGTALTAHLRARGDDVVRLVRRAPQAPDEVAWDPPSRRLDPGVLAGVDAVVHLAGAGPSDHRWTPAYQRELLTSRVDGTTTVANALAALGAPVRLVSQSAIGWYGDRGEEVLSEDSGPGAGFVPEMVRAWEASAEPAREAGLSVAHPRTGLVMAANGGALERMTELARLGINGPLGSGRQWWSWVSLHDAVAALAHLVDHPEVTGPVNVVAPEPVRQREVARALGHALHRPAVLPAPAFGVRWVLGGFADEVLTSKRVSPSLLITSGFTHRDTDLAQLVRAEVGR
jgi:uncharacterized protein (TIGR01777 family)